MGIGSLGDTIPRAREAPPQGWDDQSISKTPDEGRVDANKRSCRYAGDSEQVRKAPLACVFGGVSAN